MSGNDRNGAGEKTHQPTQRKLQKSREQGEVPYSSEATVAATYASFYFALILAGGWSAAKVCEILLAFFRRPADVGAALMSPAPSGFAERVVIELALALAPLFGALALAALASILAQRAVVFAPSKIKPKLSRLSIIDNAKQKYGPQGLFEFFKSFAKLSAITVILLFGLKDRFMELPSLSALPAQAFGEIVLREATFFLGLVTAAAVAIAAIDLPWRIYQHRKKLMMSHQELKEESKETEGDPTLKAARRERANALARNRMLADVPEASVVIVNPTHYAVALKWEREKGGAPVCVAKGVDEIAARIREIAAKAGVPIRRDPPTARSIYAVVEIGEEIRREHYAAVAAAIHYADEVQRKAKGGRAP
ncbi:MAG: EscU/YscU/HrcU family type III secretion system export apparatus switch protein [Amphiplicatus sp.]